MKDRLRAAKALQVLSLKDGERAMTCPWLLLEMKRDACIVMFPSVYQEIAFHTHQLSFLF